ncbi:MAG: preprotein translocase subunit SecG [Planctomycetes bacterium]|nr:preprotein translocase subunit SecG [Planctomycetota bacterium]
MQQVFPAVLAFTWPTWMIGIVTVLFMAVCVIMVLTVLIQKPQGGGLASAFGGGASAGQTAFGTKTGDALTVFTIAVFVLYLVCAVILNYAARPPAPETGTTVKAPAGAPAGDGKTESTPATTPADQNQPATTPTGEKPADVPAKPADKAPEAPVTPAGAGNGPAVNPAPTQPQTPPPAPAPTNPEPKRSENR